MVGRPRQFDEDLALDSAMQAFWAKGYEATSLADLMAATGLHKGSLYQAFGDKHSLFIRALNRYLEEMRSRSAPTSDRRAERSAAFAKAMASSVSIRSRSATASSTRPDAASARFLASSASSSASSTVWANAVSGSAAPRAATSIRVARRGRSFRIAS